MGKGACPEVASLSTVEKTYLLIRNTNGEPDNGRSLPTRRDQYIAEPWISVLTLQADKLAHLARLQAAWADLVARPASH
jgi:hypothetical protein